MKRITKAIKRFFKLTTLHGFKYLISEDYYDRIAWAICCLASACCAGGLCLALWKRFLEMPALLQRHEVSSDVNFQPLPTVTFCQPLEIVTETFLKHLNTKGKNTTRIPVTIANALQGKNADAIQLDLLEELLRFNNVTLLEMLILYTPDCTQLFKMCRWRDVSMLCERLFNRVLTNWGVCCVATPTRFINTFIPVMQRYDIIKKLDIALKCSDHSHGFEFVTKYFGEDWITPTRLNPGYNYMAHLTFISEKDHDEEKLVAGACESSKKYSRSQCMIECTEKICGCSDPFKKLNRLTNEEIPPPCPLKRLSCVRSFSKAKTMCSCLPACQKIITKLVVERASYKGMQSTLDPIYSDLNDTHSVVLRLRINIDASKLFVLKPNETWLTLLSSLGGVFNMFLGVGLFSALEFLFLIIVKIPMAMRKDTKEIVPFKKVTFDR